MSTSPINRMVDEACKCRECGAQPFRCECWVTEAEILRWKDAAKDIGLGADHLRAICVLALEGLAARRARRKS